MDMVKKNNLEELLSCQKGCCVSMFMSTSRKGIDAHQNSVKFKNLIKDAEKRLKESSMSISEIKQLLKPAKKIIDEISFWEHQSDSLGVFISEACFKYYRLPFNFEEVLVVSSHFHLKPLLPLFSGEGSFYFLALSQNNIRLLHGTHYGISDITPEHMPKNFKDALQLDNPCRQMQARPKSASSSSTRPSLFHGQGGAADDTGHKTNILRYFQKINKSMQEVFHGKSIPLVLAGVEYLIPIYREANTYPYLIDGHITGNPDVLTDQELHDKAWPILKPIFTKMQKDFMAKYFQLAGSTHVSDDLREVVIAAFQGRIKFLFLPLGVHDWGRFNADTNQVRLDRDQTSDSEDLLNFAAVQTLLHKGNVYTISPKHMPKSRHLAAIFRY
ncbi:hypothetical protein ACFL4O_02255 [bacterium]